MARLPLHPLNLLLFAVFDFVQQVLGLYFYLVIIVALSSWFSRAGVNPIITVLSQIVNPLLNPIRRILPAVAGFDFSPLVLIIIIIFLRMIFSQLTLGI